VAAGSTTDPEHRTLLLDPASGAWRWGPPSLGETVPTESADERPGRGDAPTVAADDRLVVWGGGVTRAEGEGSSSCCRPVTAGAVFTAPVR
jgi:hypothetical protein